MMKVLEFTLALLLMLAFSLTEASGSHITFTFIPALGSPDNLQGNATCNEPNGCKIAVFIFSNQWWTKPTFSSPVTAIRNDGTWECDISTGGSDIYASRIAAFLLRAAATVPLASAAKTLPSSLFADAVDYKVTSRGLLEWSGHLWTIKNSTASKLSPGPNYWSNRASDVWVDASNALNLAVRYYDNRWWSTEVVNVDYLGWGRYSFDLSSPVHNLDPNIVLGCFTYDTTSDQSVAPNTHRELDFEFAKWGNANDETNAQVVIQPHTMSGNLVRYSVPESHNLTCTMEWIHNGVYFEVRNATHLIFSKEYGRASSPSTGYAAWRFNLWQMNGNAPMYGQDVVVKISKFSFSPIPSPTPTIVPTPSPIPSAAQNAASSSIFVILVTILLISYCL